MFYKCKTIEDAKYLFRKLCKHLHPDTGGEVELMVLLKDSFEDWRIKNETVEERKHEDGFVYETTDTSTDVGDDEMSIIDIILLWAQSHPKFDCSFVLRMHDRVQEKGKLGSSQYNALVNIFYSWRIDKWLKEREEDE